MVSGGFLFRSAGNFDPFLGAVFLLIDAYVQIFSQVFVGATASIIYESPLGMTREKKSLFFRIFFGTGHLDS